ncbi:MAG: TIGR03915 family putative DNA repair protein [Clostridiales bacterium]|nr:TIGR03915 family putative DNA repair protein [Clostridiales bacterium]
MIYFYDGTEDAFLTAFLLAYRDEEAVITSGNSQLSLGQESVFVKTDPERAKRARQRFRELDKECLHELNLLLRSGDSSRDMTAFRYFRLIAERKRPVRGMYSEPAVVAAEECIRRVLHEAERFRGFIRFLESESGALYAAFSPDNDICDMLVPHFKARLPHYPFVLHDVARKKAAVYDGANVFFAPLDRAEVALSANEAEWQALWKRYYTSVNIPSRERLKQMRGYMPVRYWKFMPEFKNTAPKTDY